MIERQKRIAEPLTRIGVNKNIARILVYLSEVRSEISKKIMNNTNLGQSQLSLTMKELKERGWIVEREIRVRKRGEDH